MLDSDPQALFSYLIGELNHLPLAYLHLMQADELPTADQFANWPKDVMGTYAPLYQGTLIANQGYTQESAEQELASSRAALITFGTLALANPDLPARFAQHGPFNQPDRATMYGGAAHGYVDYPTLAQ